MPFRPNANGRGAALGGGNAAMAVGRQCPLQGSPVASFHHAPGVARGTDTPAFARIGHKVVVPAVITPDSGKAVGKDAAFEVLAESLADIRLGGVVVALPVELTGTGQLMPSLEVFCYGLVEQSPLGVTRVVELWLCTRWPTRVRMRLRWACGGGHGAVPAWAGRLMILGLYPALRTSLLSAGSQITPELSCGRNKGYPLPPAQIRTCRITAYGSCLRCVTHRNEPADMGVRFGWWA